MEVRSVLVVLGIVLFVTIDRGCTKPTEFVEFDIDLLKTLRRLSRFLDTHNHSDGNSDGVSDQPVKSSRQQEGAEIPTEFDTDLLSTIRRLDRLLDTREPLGGQSYDGGKRSKDQVRRQRTELERSQGDYVDFNTDDIDSIKRLGKLLDNNIPVTEDKQASHQQTERQKNYVDFDTEVIDTIKRLGRYLEKHGSTEDGGADPSVLDPLQLDERESSESQSDGTSSKMDTNLLKVLRGIDHTFYKHASKDAGPLQEEQIPHLSERELLETRPNYVEFDTDLLPSIKRLDRVLDIHGHKKDDDKMLQQLPDQEIADIHDKYVDFDADALNAITRLSRFLQLHGLSNNEDTTTLTDKKEEFTNRGIPEAHGDHANFDTDLVQTVGKLSRILESQEHLENEQLVHQLEERDVEKHPNYVEIDTDILNTIQRLGRILDSHRVRDGNARPNSKTKGSQQLAERDIPEARHDYVDVDTHLKDTVRRLNRYIENHSTLQDDIHIDSSLPEKQEINEQEIQEEQRDYIEFDTRSLKAIKRLGKLVNSRSLPQDVEDELSANLEELSSQQITERGISETKRKFVEFDTELIHTIRSLDRFLRIHGTSNTDDNPKAELANRSLHQSQTERKLSVRKHRIDHFDNELLNAIQRVDQYLPSFVSSEESSSRLLQPAERNSPETQPIDSVYKINCYFPSWAATRPERGRFTIKDIKPELCDRIHFVYARVSGYNLASVQGFDEEAYKQLNELKKSAPRLQTILSVADTDPDNGGFKDMASSKEGRKLFAHNVEAYLRKFDFDGVEINWQQPGMDSIESFTSLLQTLYAHFNREDAPSGNRLSLSTVLVAGDLFRTNKFISQIAKYADYATALTFGLPGGHDSKTGFHSALYGYKDNAQSSQDWVIKQFLEEGFPAKKLYLGVPTYGKSFTLCDAENHNVGDCASGEGHPGPYTGVAGLLAYYEICQGLNTGFSHKYDSHRQAGFAFRDDQWVGFEDTQSIAAKGAYVLHKGLAGMSFWDLSMDDFSGNCGSGEYPLLKAAQILPQLTNLLPTDVAPQAQTGKIICYFPGWIPGAYPVTSVDPSLCTHILYAFAHIEGTQLTSHHAWDQDSYQQLLALKSSNPSLKILLSVGGAAAGTAGFEHVSGTPDLRQEFAANVVDFVDQHGFDGIDIDWEYPTHPYKNKFTDLLKALREAFDGYSSKNLLLTAALTGSSYKIGQNIVDLGAIHQYLDFANLMTYDYYGFWGNEPKTGLHSALYCAGGETYCQKWTVDKYISEGFPREKLMLGIPTYGRSFKLCNSADRSVGARACANGLIGGGLMPFNQICSTASVFPDYTEVYDSEREAVYAVYWEDQWVGFDNVQSTTKKIEYANSESLGGVMYWDMAQDDHANLCGNGPYPLLNLAKQHLN